MFRKILLGLIIFHICAASSMATTYYVSKSGNANDNNDGLSWSTPWQSMIKVNAGVSGGDTVFFGTGIWYGTMLDPVSGLSAALPTVYACSAFTEGIAEIHGGDRVTNWSPHAGSVYKASYDKDPVPSWWGGNVRVVGQLGNGYDTLLYPAASIPTSPGEFYHDETSEILYVYLRGGGDPNNYVITTAKVVCVGFPNGEDHVKVWGFRLLYGRGACVAYRDVHTDSNYVEHCYMRGMGNIENAALIASSVNLPTDDPNVTKWGNVIRGCTLDGLVYVNGEGEGSQHAYGLGFYSQWGCVIESCIVIDDGTMQKGIKLKSDCWYDTVRYNYVKMKENEPADAAIQLTAAYRYVEIYGNVLDCGYGSSAGVVAIGYGNGSTVCRDVNIRNNTIINPYGTAILAPHRDNWEHIGPMSLKYNIFYLIPEANVRGAISIMKGDTTYWSIDENMYYLQAGDSLFNTEQPGLINLATWRSRYNFDLNSVFGIDPGFTDPLNHDYSRPDAVQEINATYNGRTWTVYGAWQPGDYYCPPAPPPSQSSPQNGATNITEPVLLTWGNVSGANYYGLQVDDDITFSSPLVNQQVNGNSYSLSGLSSGTTYHWRLRTNDSCGWGGWNANPWNFTTECSALLSPVLSSPQNGATGLIQPVGLEWQSMVGASYYIVQVDTNASFGAPLVNAQSTGNLFPVSGLPINYSLYWQVRAVNACGSGPWSATWSFSTSEDTSSIINLALGIIPHVDGTYLGYDSVKITDEITDPYGGTNTTWASSESSVSPHFIEIDFGAVRLVQYAVLYWAWNSYSSSWMTSREIHLQYWDMSLDSYLDAEVVIQSGQDSFTTIQFEPDIATSKIRYFQPANMGPVNYPVILWISEFEIYGLASSIPTPDPLGTYIDVENGYANTYSTVVDGGVPLFYEFQLDTLVNFQTARLEIPLTVTDTAIATFDNLIVGSEYCWRVRAVAQDSSNYSGWSSITTFLFGAVGAGDPCSGISPSQGQAIDTNIPVFQATCENASSYIYFQFDDNSGFSSPVESGPVTIAANNIATWQAPDPLANEQNYYWRASIDDINWFEAIQFRVAMDIHAYPVPFKRKAGHSTITFTNLPDRSRVTVATISGSIVKMTDILQGGDWVWDVTNDNHDSIASGVYLYAIEFPAGASRGKLVVIK